MTQASDPSRSARLPSGRWGQALIRLFMKRAHVTAVESVAAGFQLIALESPAFKGCAWTPGQKVQIAMGSAFVARTFTPIEWDAGAGRTCILGFAHGEGPASAWLREVREGDSCDVFGPRTSLDLRAFSGPLVLFGDETSMGLACAIRRQRPDRLTHVLLETSAVTDARKALARLDLQQAELFERTPDEAQLQEIERRLASFTDPETEFVLTGKASSIQGLRRAAKGLGIAGDRIATKAYWASGKMGLD